MLRKEFNSVGNVGAVVFIYMYCVTAVVIQGRAKVPPVNTVWGPGATLLWFLMDNDSGAWRCQGVSVVAVWPVKEIMC